MADPNIDASALDELNSPETRTLFDTADKLSSLGVGRIVNLPQIIVVGDQSSGKSSVLEAISHVHFPVHGGLCTRFATELVLRPGSRKHVTATVQFSDTAKPAYTLQVADFNQDDIEKIIATAKEQMGVSDTGRDFSKDVLRLVIEGPQMYPLTLVDLPGIFHTETAKQSAAGKATVMELLQSYMKKPNSIILAIVSANNQLANQVVMQEALKYDPSKERTLGVITKPDLLHPGSSEELEYIQIVRGREAVHNLSLGWHVLRNRAGHEEDLGPRDSIEETFFKSGAWSSVPPTIRGVASLRRKLSQILLDHIKKSLPLVLEDIQQKLSQRELELSRLGQARTTPEDIRSYLIDVAGHFQRLIHDGISGHYEDGFFGGFDGTDRKLRSQLRNFNRAIRHILLTHGSAQEIINDPVTNFPRRQVPEYLQEFLQANPYNLPAPELITSEELVILLERQAAANQGTEFPGYANMNLVIQLFQKQAKPWEMIAKLHVEKVTQVAQAFVEEAFEHIVGSPSSNRTTGAILSTFVDFFFEEKEQILVAKLEEIIRPFKKGYALPLDADFHEAMDKKTAMRIASQSDLQANSEQHTQFVQESQSSTDFGTERIIDTMQTFYDMALRTFTDNLINLAIESCLIRELPTIFTAKLVNNMSDTSLTDLAAESDEIRDHRSQLQKDIKLLKQGLQQCRRHKPRAVATGLVAGASSSPGKSRVVPVISQGSPKIKVQNDTTATSSGSIGGKSPKPSLFESVISSTATDQTSNAFGGKGTLPTGKPVSIFGSPKATPNSSASSEHLAPKPFSPSPFSSSAASPAFGRTTAQSGGLFGSTSTSSFTSLSGTPAPTTGVFGPSRLFPTGEESTFGSGVGSKTKTSTQNPFAKTTPGTTANFGGSKIAPTSQQTATANKSTSTM